MKKQIDIKRFIIRLLMPVAACAGTVAAVVLLVPSNPKTGNPGALAFILAMLEIMTATVWLAAETVISHRRKEMRKRNAGLLPLLLIGTPLLIALYFLYIAR